MKRIKYFAVVCMSFAMLLSFSTIAMAASSKPYQDYVNTKMVPSLGKASTGTKKTTIASKNFTSWCKTKGVLSVYTADLNNDKKNEALVVYLKNNVNQAYSQKPLKALHLAVLSQKNGKVAVIQDITINDQVDSGLKSDFKMYVKTHNKKKYVVLQEFFGIDGCGCSTFVLTMKTNGKLAVKKAVYDPGYTSGIGLYRLPMSGVQNRLVPSSYGKTLYTTEKSWDASSNKTYGKKLQNEIQNYGLNVRVAKTYFGTKAWIIQKNSNMKLLCSIKAKAKYSNKTYQYTYVVSDHTNFK